MEDICGATFAFDHGGPPELIGNELTVAFPDREVVAGPGTFVFVPRGVEHTAHATAPVRGLIIYSPGDAEHVTQPVVAS